MIQKNQLWNPHSDAVAVNCADGLTRRVLAYNDNIMCVENSFETGAVGVLHNHPHTQLTYVVKGRFSFSIDGDNRIITAGDSMIKEGNLTHGCTCLEEGILLEIFTPMRESFV